MDGATKIADQFNCHFSTTADKLRRSLSSIPMELSKLVRFVGSRKDPKECFSVLGISFVQVKNINMNINAHKSSGIDTISARLLRSSAAAVAPSIIRLNNLSFSSGKISSRWKTPKSHLYLRMAWRVTLVTFALYLSSRFSQR